MHNQVALTGTAARVWQGQGTVTLRAPLTAERAQVWDSRVAQYIGASPSSTRGGNSHPYMGAPPSGLASSATASGSLYIGPSGNPSFAAEGRCGDFNPRARGFHEGACDFCGRDRDCYQVEGEYIGYTRRVCVERPPRPGYPMGDLFCYDDPYFLPYVVGFMCAGDTEPLQTFDHDNTEIYWLTNCLDVGCIATPFGPFCRARLQCATRLIERNRNPRPRRICDSMRYVDEPTWGDAPTPPFEANWGDVPRPDGRP